MPTRTRPFPLWPALLLLFAIVAAPPAHATVVGPLSETLLTARARVIIIGRVVDVSSHWDTGQGQTLTDIRVSLDEVLKGMAPGPELTIRQLGGRVGDVESRVEGSPAFGLGERVLLFLTTRRDGTLRVAHLYLGKFSIQTDVLTGETFAHRDTPPGVIVATPPGTRGAPKLRERHRLRELRDSIRGARRGSSPWPDSTPPLFTPPAPLGTTETQASFTFLGTPSRWFEPDTGGAVVMRLNAEGEPRATSRGVDQVNAAYAAWSSVSGSSFRFGDAGATAAFGHRRDGVNTVSFGDPLGQMDDPVNCGGVLAMGGYFSTSSQQRTVNGRLFNRIVEGDVVVNGGWDGCGLYESFANRGRSGHARARSRPGPGALCRARSHDGAASTLRWAGRQPARR